MLSVNNFTLRLMYKFFICSLSPFHWHLWFAFVVVITCFLFLSIVVSGYISSTTSSLTNFGSCIVDFFVLVAIISQKGSDAWWYMRVEDLLPDGYRHKAAEYEKGTDTMDVWFDSGTNIQCCT